MPPRKFLFPLLDPPADSQVERSKKMLDLPQKQQHPWPTFAMQLEGILSQEECKRIIDHTNPYLDLNDQNKNDADYSERANFFVHDKRFADVLWQRVQPLLPALIPIVPGCGLKGKKLRVHPEAEVAQPCRFETRSPSLG